MRYEIYRANPSDNKHFAEPLTIITLQYTPHTFAFDRRGSLLPVDFKQFDQRQISFRAMFRNSGTCLGCPNGFLEDRILFSRYSTKSHQKIKNKSETTEITSCYT